MADYVTILHIEQVSGLRREFKQTLTHTPSYLTGLTYQHPERCNNLWFKYMV